MFEKLRKSESKGFTLIEIVLVLAIAGLIMVIVFIAVGGAQKARRDTQRKSDASRYLAAVEQAASNNGGTYPTAALVAATGLPTPFNDPTLGTSYVVTYGTTAPVNTGDMSFSSGATCGASGAINAVAASLNKVAVAVKLESGAVACVSN